jgi:hypothetical protein
MLSMHIRDMPELNKTKLKTGWFFVLFLFLLFCFSYNKKIHSDVQTPITSWYCWIKLFWLGNCIDYIINILYHTVSHLKNFSVVLKEMSGPENVDYIMQPFSLTLTLGVATWMYLEGSNLDVVQIVSWWGSFKLSNFKTCESSTSYRADMCHNGDHFCQVFLKHCSGLNVMEVTRNVDFSTLVL